MRAMHGNGDLYIYFCSCSLPSTHFSILFCQHILQLSLHPCMSAHSLILYQMVRLEYQDNTHRCFSTKKPLGGNTGRSKRRQWEPAWVVGLTFQSFSLWEQVKVALRQTSATWKARMCKKGVHKLVIMYNKYCDSFSLFTRHFYLSITQSERQQKKFSFTNICYSDHQQ